MLAILLLPLLPGPLWSGVIAPDRVLSMGQIELNCNSALLNCFKLIVFFIYQWVNKKTLLTVNWIVGNRIVLTFNCANKTELILNRIVSHFYENNLIWRWITLKGLIRRKIKEPTNQPTYSVRKQNLE